MQRYLAQMVSADCQAAVLEATSHGLHQGRVAAVDFDVAVVTNVTHEHLDYHGTWEAYLGAKALLFHNLKSSAYKPVVGAGADVRLVAGPTDVLKDKQPKAAVLNADDASYPHLRAIPADWTLSYGLDDAAADVRATDIVYQAARTTFTATTPSGLARIDLPLPGRFNVYNALAALSAGLALGLPLDRLAAAVATTAARALADSAAQASAVAIAWAVASTAAAVCASAVAMAWAVTTTAVAVRLGVAVAVGVGVGVRLW